MVSPLSDFALKDIWNAAKFISFTNYTPERRALANAVHIAAIKMVCDMWTDSSDVAAFLIDLRKQLGSAK